MFYLIVFMVLLRLAAGTQGVSKFHIIRDIFNSFDKIILKRTVTQYLTQTVCLPGTIYSVHTEMISNMSMGTSLDQEFYHVTM